MYLIDRPAGDKEVGGCFWGDKISVRECSIYLSTCPSVYLIVFFTYLSTFIYVSVYLWARPINPSIHLSTVYLSISLYIYLSIYLSICLSIYQSVYLSIDLSLDASIHNFEWLSMPLVKHISQVQTLGSSVPLRTTHYGPPAPSGRSTQNAWGNLPMEARGTRWGPLWGGAPLVFE